MMPTSDDGWLAFFSQLYLWATFGVVLFGGLALLASRFMQVYSDRISRGQNQRIVEAQRDAALANEQSKQLEAEIAQAKLDAATALRTAEHERLVRAEIEESTAWRRIDQDTQAKLAHRLESFRGQTASVWYHVGDHEAEAFATEIALALRAANWNTYNPASMTTMAGAGYKGEIKIPRSDGLRVASTEDSSSRTAASAFVREIIALGFDAKLAPIERRDSPIVIITIDVRPYGPQGKAKLRKFVQ